MRENWKDIPGFEGSYQASTLGNIRSLDRVVQYSNGKMVRRRGVILKPYTTWSGHKVVRLGRDREAHGVHCLVALTWLGPRPEGQEVRHGVKGVDDNSVGNLSYGTTSDNQLDRYRDGTMKGTSVVRSDSKVFQTMRGAARETGCHSQNIWDVCNGKRTTAGGHTWRYNK